MKKNKLYSKKEYILFDQWGTYKDNDQTFPFTFSNVSKAACDAIINTLHKNIGPNPNIVSNAMSRSVFHYRPIQNLERDMGRIGIELDGIQYLLNDSNNPMKERLGLIRMVLLIALNLSNHKLWETNQTRPIILYFTTMKEVLLASKQLKYLKTEYPKKSLFFMNLDTFDSIQIKCLGDDIPKYMKTKHTSNQIDPTKGIIFLVQPTSTYSSLISPSKSYSVPPLESIQKTMIRATLYDIPLIMISPRFQSVQECEHYVPANKRGGLDSSGYQHSDIYGGFEPVRPSPWLLRDFNPPIFAWVATSIGEQKVGLYHSVMDTSQAWHLFTKVNNYQYMASTKPSSGRPSKSIIQAILYDYINN